MKKLYHISDESLLEWGMNCLMSFGLSEKDAHFVSNSLIKTSLWGIDSHGIARLPHYLNRIESEQIKSSPNIKVENTGYTYFTGDPGRNPDDFVHARLYEIRNNLVLVRFEDLFGGGDKDYNDVNFIVQMTDEQVL